MKKQEGLNIAIAILMQLKTSGRTYFERKELFNDPSLIDVKNDYRGRILQDLSDSKNNFGIHIRKVNPKIHDGKWQIL